MIRRPPQNSLTFQTRHFEEESLLFKAKDDKLPYGERVIGVLVVELFRHFVRIVWLSRGPETGEKQVKIETSKNASPGYAIVWHVAIVMSMKTDGVPKNFWIKPIFSGTQENLT